jgi:hypothetical protein
VDADTIKRVVTLFEVFSRAEFQKRVADPADVLSKAGRGSFSASMQRMHCSRRTLAYASRS